MRHVWTMLAGVCLVSAGVRAADEAEQRSYAAHMAAAFSAHRLNEPAEARRWLDAAPANLRGWEWAHLDSLLDQSLDVSPPLGSEVTSIALDKEGRRAAIGLSDGEIVLWDLEARKQVSVLTGHPGGVFCVRFSPDGTRLASGGRDRVARVWDLATGESALEFKEHKFPVTSVTFTRDGSKIASAAYYVDKETPIHGRVHLWDAASGSVLKTWRGGRKPLSCLEFTPDEESIAAGSWDSVVFLWDVEAGGDPREFGQAPSPDSAIRINTIAFSPDGALLAAGSDVGWARVYDAQSGAVVTTLSPTDSDVNGVAFSPSGAVLAAGCDDGSIRLWDSADWKERAVLRGHSAAVRSLVWLADGSRLISGSLDKTVRTWDPARKDYDGVRARFARSNYSVSFSPDGRLLACSSGDGTAGLVDSWSGEKRASWEAHPGGEVCTAAFSPDGARVATCSWDKTVKVFDLTGREILYADLPAGVALIAWRSDGKQIAAALRNNEAALIDAETGSIVRTFAGHEGRVNSVAFNPDGTRLATTSADSTVRLWDVEGGRGVSVLRGHTGNVESCVFLPDGARLVTGSTDGSVRLWDSKTGREIALLFQTDQSIYRVAVSPDGSRVAAGGEQLFIIDAVHGGVVLRCRPVIEGLWDVEWSPDGRRLAVTSWNGTIAVLDSVPLRERESGPPE